MSESRSSSCESEVELDNSPLGPGEIRNQDALVNMFQTLEVSNVLEKVQFHQEKLAPQEKNDYDIFFNSPQNFVQNLQRETAAKSGNISHDKNAHMNRHSRQNYFPHYESRKNSGPPVWPFPRPLLDLEPSEEDGIVLENQHLPVDYVFGDERHVCTSESKQNKTKSKCKDLKISRYLSHISLIFIIFYIKQYNPLNDGIHSIAIVIECLILYQTFFVPWSSWKCFSLSIVSILLYDSVDQLLPLLTTQLRVQFFSLFQSKYIQEKELLIQFFNIYYIEILLGLLATITIVSNLMPKKRKSSSQSS